MLRKFALLLSIGGSAISLLAASANADRFTTRIETRPYYGAVVTLEHGVRVYRPLPPDRYVIINPDRVPLSLSISDTNIYGWNSSASASGYGGDAYAGDGLYHAPASGLAYQWRPGFYHIGGPRDETHLRHRRPPNDPPHAIQPAP
ncbi:hypothetical protein [Hyphomicrobium sp.]|uniref:hypothetical protein n=1 Tax=Hyphomicrobium sp. TaxID=82 RepID=UPI000FA820C5|nr:hypothetical protein [Hyphomicrobium sp.]RUP09401.1 MAG: hypothetical protein EKK38_08520 [Hyphomicrobium sp.]